MTNETTASERERFEVAFPKPDFVVRTDAGYTAKYGWEYSYAVERYAGSWEGWQARAALPAPADQVLVPKRLTRAMREVLDEEGWTWEDLLAAAEAITEAEYAELQAAPADQPPSQEPHGSSGSLPESGVEAGTQVAAPALPGLSTMKIVVRNAFLNGLAWMEANGDALPQAWGPAADEFVARWEPSEDNPLNYPHECSAPSCLCESGRCDAEEANDRITQRIIERRVIELASRTNADAAVVSAQHGASDNSEQDQPKG